VSQAEASAPAAAAIGTSASGGGAGGAPSSSATIGKNTIWLVLGQGVSMVVMLLTVPVLLHRLGAEAFGAYTTAMATMGFLGLLQIGAGTALRKFLADAFATGDVDGIRRLTATGLAWAGSVGVVVVALVLFAARPVLIPLLHPSAELRAPTLWCLWLAGIGLAFDMVGGVLATIPFAAQRMEASTIPDTAVNVASRLSAVGAVLAGLGLTGLVAMLVVWQGVRLVWRAIVARRIVPGLRMAPRFHRVETRRVLRFGGWQLVTDIFGTIAFRVDTLMIGHFWSLSEVPIYSIPMSVCMSVSGMFGLFHQAVFPEACARMAAGDKRGVRDLYLRHVRTVVAVSSPIFVFLAVAAPGILALWLGKAADPRMAWVLSCLAASLVVQALTGVQFTYVLAANKPEYLAWEALGLAPVYILLFLVLIPPLGALGPAATYGILTLAIVIPVNVVAFGRATVGAGAWGHALSMWGRAVAVAAATFGLAGLLWRAKVGWGLETVGVLGALALCGVLSTKLGLIRRSDVEAAHRALMAFRASSRLREGTA